MQREDLIRLTHMRDAAASALRFVEGRVRQDLDRDEMLLFALVRAVEVFGEAAAKVSAEARAEVPDVRWAAVIGMRNRLVHAYFDVDRDILWACQDNCRRPPMCRSAHTIVVGARSSLEWVPI